MGNLKKINIYVGVVGQAYVDKETAKRNLDRAQQNINDWNDIISLAQTVLDHTNPVSENLIAAKSKANTVRTLLETEMNNSINDNEKHDALSNLYNELNALDTDNDFNNGGNTYTLDQINNTLNSIIQEINDISVKSQNNKTYWESIVSDYQQAYDTAVDVFNSYIPEEQNNPLDESDQLETEFTERLHEIDDQLQEFNTAIGKVNEVSDKTNQEIENIVGTTVPDEPSDPEVQNYFYVGTAKPTSLSEAQIIDEYLDEQTYTNNSGEKAHIFVLTNNDKNVTFIEPNANSPITQASVDIETIPGYNIFETAVGVAHTGVIKIRIS